MVFTMCLYADLAIAWSGLLMFDFIVFLLTLWASLRVRMVRNRSVTDILLRDGVFNHFHYFYLLID